MRVSMPSGLHALMLLSDAFGGFGGIAKFNRDFLIALNACPEVERIHVLPRLISEPIDDLLPDSVIYDRVAAKGKLSFLFRTLFRILFDDRIDLVICGHIHLLPLAWVAAKFRRAELVLIIHGVEAWIPTRGMLVNRLASTVDHLIAVSHFSAAKFAAWSKIATNKIFILPNCVDLARFQPRERNRLLSDRYKLGTRRVIMTMGRLSSEERYKGFDEVIEVLPQLLLRIPNLKYLIVGDGLDRERLEAKVKSFGVAEHVIFAGRVLELEKVDHYSLADAYVMPSSGEGFGIVLIEAIACGVPVIGSLADGSREALLDGQLGKLVDPRDKNKLAEEIETLLTIPPKGQRNDGVAFFSVENFRARVANWVAEMTARRIPYSK